MPSMIPLVLFAEDDHEDWALMKDALEECRQGELKWERCVDGVELLKRLENKALPKPDMIMLDLKMPKKDGAEVLQEIRGNPDLRHIPVIILTTSRLEADIFLAYHQGANSYVVKPVTYDAIKTALCEIRHYWTNVVVPPPRRMAPA